MKYCFEELHTFLSMGGDISAEPNKQSVRNFQAAEGLCGKKSYIFLFLCVPVSFGEMNIKHAQIQSY